MSKRKEKILEAIVKEYIGVKEPISSKSIKEKYNLNVSSATIRNEMAILEKEGLIKQNHISSGRIPTALGYRFYVDNFINNTCLELDDSLVESFFSEIAKKRDLIDGLGNFISNETNYPVFLLEEKIDSKGIHKVRLTCLTDEKVLLIVMLSEDEIKDFIINIMDKYNEKKLIKYSELLNDYLKNINLQDLNMNIFDNLEKDLGKDDVLFKEIIKCLKKAYLRDEKKILVQGMAKICESCEIKDMKQLTQIMKVIENESTLKLLMEKKMGEEDYEVNIAIGEEIGEEFLGDFSVVSKVLNADQRTRIRITILGPTSMEYEDNVNLLRITEKLINKL